VMQLRFRTSPWLELIIAISTVALFIVILTSRDLRPIADDYCAASFATRGLLADMVDAWNFRGGDLVSIF
jgi:hypothetical protein